MAKIDDILRRMRTAPHDVPFDDVAKLCEHCFGKAKAYQVKQVLQAVHKLQTEKLETSGRDDDHAE